MCGIVGFWDPSRRWTAAHLPAATQALAHRGPDDEGFHYDEAAGLGLGHRRLSILDLSPAGHQPMASHSGRLQIVFNGEVYNYRELAQAHGIALRSSSDTELILELIEKLGFEQALQQMNGMFAIALWDSHTRQLHLARDRVGIKPLYYYWDGQRLAFASELKGLLALGIDRTLNMAALQHYLFLEYVPAPLSIFNKVSRLTAGQRLTLTPDAKGGLQAPVLHTYYSLYDKLGQPFEGGEAQALERFEELLASSVRYRQIADVPLGAFLSGGTDSSLVVAHFQKQNTQPVRSFTIGFEEAAFDETQYAQAVALHLGTQHQTTRLPASAAMALVEKVASHYDEPFASASALPSLLVCQQARQQVTVAFSGDGGDELFMGYGYYGWWQRLQRLGKLAPLVGGLAGLLGGIDARFAREAERLHAMATHTPYLHLWSRAQGGFTVKEIEALTGTAFDTSLLQASWARAQAATRHPWQAISLFDLQHYLPDNLLYKMDIASMAYALEVRVPLLDHRLVEFALNLPMALRRQGSHAKYLMKKALCRHLPQVLVYRKKWGFPSPINQWLAGPLQPLMAQQLAAESLQQHNLVDATLAQQYQANHLAGKATGNRAWALVQLQLWAQQYLATGQPVSTPAV